MRASIIMKKELLTDAEIGAILYLLGVEVGRLRSCEANERGEKCYSEEINFYKNLAFKLNGTI